VEIVVSLASWFNKLISPRPKEQQVELGRNDLCWCGSGKKYKKCHYKSDEIKRVEARYSAQLTARQAGRGGIVPGKAGKAGKAKQQPAAEPPVKR
jgi:hypothetical protein